MDFQQPRPYMRPPPPHPPPSTADPYQRPPPPPNQQWSSYSAPQFHYQPQLQHSSSPPPQWPPPPPPPPVHSSDHSHYPPYPAHQPPPYPAHPHYPPAHPLPPRPPHVPHSYSQNWENASWGHHQNWEYQAHNNEEDWATKARAWAAAKAATENQLPQSQVTQVGRPEEQNSFHDQYSQSVDTQFMDVQQPSASASSYQHYPVGTAPPYRTPLGQSQQPPFISSGQSSYAMEVHLPPYTASDGNLAGNTTFTQQEKSSISSFVHQQEVPSSYSSTADKEAGDINGEFNRSSSLPPVASVSQLYAQPLPPTVGRSGWMEEPHYSLSGQKAESATDLSDQPLNFAPHFNRNQDPHLQPHTHSSGGPARAVDPVAAIPSNYAWAPAAASEGHYPSVPPAIPSGPQVDHSMVVPSPASGHSTSMFPTGASFQPTGPIIGASFGVGAGSALHPTVAFNGDAFGVSSVSERPRKASVPNWLREEIIKNKASIPSSVPEFPKEDSQSVEEESVDRSSRKGDQADSKSIDSSRSTEDEDEDEDEVEAARAAAINQEIKRVLTEVLLKVTDELFDEIATKVLNEDDLTVEVDHNTDLPNHKVLPSTPTGSTPKASAKVLIPIKTKETASENVSEKSVTAGDVLGLASYDSDDEDEEIQSSGKPDSKENSAHEQSISSKLLIETPAVQHGGSKEETDERGNILANAETDGTGKTKTNITGAHLGTASTELIDNRVAIELACSDNQFSSKTESGVADEMRHVHDASKSEETVTGKAVEIAGRQDRNSDSRKSTRDDSPSRHTRNRSDMNDRNNNKNNHIGKDYDRVVESFKERVDKKGDEDHRRHEERHARNERTDDRNGSKDKVKGIGRSGEKVKDSESRKRCSPSDVKEGRQQTDREKRSSGKEGNERKERTKDELRERSRHKNGSDSSRHKRRRSSSVDGRGRESKDNSVVSHANNSSDESLGDSKRKSHHSRKRKSPSPVRSRKRQVSRSPHSKHSQRRHSPYSSLETTRGRSRSRSPVRRRQ
ncbi:cyclin-related [Forsythia ovata]|uniref:Cyclin-related n=1 Tax=Forsythia ovata TaxID=205694 RepID=A0ABD1WE70_9LAMI